MSNYYAILGVPETATQAEIRAAYLHLLKKIHPDTVATLSPGLKREANEVTQEIIMAYSVLSDSNKRAEYDRELASYPRQSAPRNSHKKHRHHRRRRQTSTADELRTWQTAIPTCLLLGFLVPVLAGIVATVFARMIGGGDSNDARVGFAVLEFPITGLLGWARYRAYQYPTRSPGSRGWSRGVLLAFVLNAIYTAVAIAASF